MNRIAIVSVYDKSSLEPFVRGLIALDVEILSTGGTAQFLRQQGIPIRTISEYTGSPEILEGRVKSLHPKIHGGILARRDREDDQSDLARQGISPIDFVVVNLYPFIQKMHETERAGVVEHESLVEVIDIGGPTMIRAAAKNCRDVVPLCDPTDYPAVLEELQKSGKVSLETRRRLATKVFTMMAAYDGAIARYFSLNERLLESDGTPVRLAPVESYTLEQKMPLRYGENPHQHAGLYRQFVFAGTEVPAWWEQVQGKELSYNNLLDMHGALELFLELLDGLGDSHTAVIIKHSNPCGAAIRATALEAFIAARDCDPLSAFGGIVAVSGTIDGALASTITEGFVEVVLAQEISEEGRSVFAKKKNVRVLECDIPKYLAARAQGTVTLRNSFGDFLVQTGDTQLTLPSADAPATGGPVSKTVLADLVFAWKLCKHVKSNAIVLVKNLQAIGIGAGQMSRVDSAKIALQRARFHNHSAGGCVAASDAFLPFSDTLEILHEGGVQSLVQPGGSIKDEDVIQSARERSMLMVFTGERHFRH